MKREREREEGLKVIVLNYLNQLVSKFTDPEQALRDAVMQSGMAADDFLDEVNKRRESQTRLV